MHQRTRIALSVFTISALSMVALTAQSGSGRALKIEDYYRVRSVGSPSISPDGRWVAVTVTTRVEDDKDASKNASPGWFGPLDGGAAPPRVADGDVTNLRCRRVCRIDRPRLAVAGAGAAA